MVHEKSFEELKTGEILLARATFTGMRYNSVDDDPIELPQAAGTNIGLEDLGVVEKALYRIMEEANSNKVSKQEQHRLAGILQTFRTVFHI